MNLTPTANFAIGISLLLLPILIGLCIYRLIVGF